VFWPFRGFPVYLQYPFGIPHVLVMFLKGILYVWGSMRAVSRICAVSDTGTAENCPIRTSLLTDRFPGKIVTETSARGTLAQSLVKTEQHRIFAACQVHA
jgi:hypothetical protein